MRERHYGTFGYTELIPAAIAGVFAGLAFGAHDMHTDFLALAADANAESEHTYYAWRASDAADRRNAHVVMSFLTALAGASLYLYKRRV